MLLAEYMGDNRYSYLRQSIKCFSFGEQYTLELGVGKSIGFVDLEDILDVMVSEFKAANAVAIIGFSEHGWSRVSNVKTPRKLIVTAHHLAVGDECNIDKIADQVRRAVTMYSLTQSWDQVHRAVAMYNLTQSWERFNKGNL